MKKLLSLVLILVSLTVFSQTQNPYLVWEQTYGGSGTEVVWSTIQTSDDGYLLGGETYSNDGDIQSGNHGDVDFWVVKINSTGTIEWEQTYGGADEDRLYSIIATSDDGYLLGGETYSNDGDVQSGNHGWIDFWVVKINSTGNIEWEKTYGGSSHERLYSTIQASDGGYVLGGYTISNDGDVQSGNHGSGDLWVVKINSTGNIEWEQTYGGSGGESINSITNTTDGGYVLGGYTNSNDGDVQSGNHGETDFWVVKINSTGTIEWEQTYGGTMEEQFKSIIATSDDGYLLVGGTYSNDGDVQSGNHGDRDCWVVKINSTGNIEWEKTYGGSNSEITTSITNTSDGGYVLGCGTRSNDGDVQSGNHGSGDLWVVKINSTGNIEWEQTYGGTSGDYSLSNSIIATSDNDYLLGGYTQSNDGDIQSGNHGETDFWVVITGMNNFPTNITLSNSTLNENLPIGTLVGAFTTTDEDIDDTHTYTLVSGDGDTDNDSFSITDDNLLTGEIFDYESQSSYSIRVQSDDGHGGTFSKSFIINVNNIDDFPTDVQLANSTVDENSPIGTEIGTLSSVGVSLPETYVYSFVSGEGDTDNGSFSISDDVLLTDEIFDYETKSSYSIRIQTEDGNGSFSKSFSILVNNINDMVITNIIFGIPFCTDDETGSIEIEVSEYIQPLSFLWSSGQTTQNIYNVTPGNYSVTITDGEGMELTEQFYLEPLPIFQGTNICYLTSDGTFNVVYIDKGSENYNVDGYNVYREGSSVGVYNYVGEINANENYFTDTTINNMTRSYSYKVSMTDKCGNESTQSTNHSTIHLSINSGTNNEVNLYWSPYIGLNPPSYSIYRKLLNEDFVLLEEISSNNNTYTDFPSEDNALYEYYISFEIENTCDTAINRNPNEVVEIKSNHVSLGATGVGNEFSDEKIKIYPNPVKDKLFVDFENLPLNVDRILLINAAGKKVFTSEGRELKSKIIEIPVLNYSPGFYNLHLSTKEGVLQRKVVVVR